MSQPDPPTDQPACPVDHNSRTAWLQAAATQAQHAEAHPPHPPTTTSSLPIGGSCDSSTIEASQSTQAKAQTPSRSLRPAFASRRTPALSTEREVSTIPRASIPGITPLPTPDHSSSASSVTQPVARSPSQPTLSPNAQTTSPATSPSGHWVYPSESQFHAALVRKHGAQAAPPADAIPPIIPIHNAVNERTWREVLGWERCCARGVRGLREKGVESYAGDGGPASTATVPANAKQPSHAANDVGQNHDRAAPPASTPPQPKLVSFSGDSQKRTPRARWLTLLGYSAPFDRHDWTVERAGGERVEYVIDFYAGKAGMGPLSFYLDVRPKLNQWEGWRMRFLRYWGW